MKKWIAVLLILCLLLSGCGAEAPVETTEDLYIPEDSNYSDILPDDFLEPPWEEETFDEEVMLREDTMHEITVAISDKVYLADTTSEGFAALSDCEKVVFAVDYFDMEVQNGGLCQFFVNSGDVVAPYLRIALEAVGAERHQVLFDNFVREYDIDINDLSSFHITSIDEYQEQYERYPFNEFDEAYIVLEPLSDYLWNYIDANIDQLQ